MKLHLLITFAFFVLSHFAAKSQLNMELLGSLEYTERASDIWGYVDEAGNEYAIMGLFNGTAVIDVTDPSNPVEIFFAPGPSSIWRDIKTWDDYAYVSNESDDGILIIDLSPLPDDPVTNTVNFTGQTYPFTTSHNIYIDETGKLYIFGANGFASGAIICDLTEDPMAPIELGAYDLDYLHDGMARGDTLWGGAIYAGQLQAIDVSNPSNPVLMGSASTPGQFCHNVWVSDDGKHVFTTDEVSNGYVGAFNVENMNNIFEVDRIQSSPGSNVIPHNAHVLNDFIITSYYTDGVVVHDGKYADRLVEVANFDTSPFSGGGFNGCWGAYPFLPSGNILASDIEFGLFVLSIEYVRASYLEGKVVDSETNSPLFNVEVEIEGTEFVTSTDFLGNFNFDFTLSGTFDVSFSLSGFKPLLLSGVEIINGEITTQNVSLEPLTISVQEAKPYDQMQIYPNPFSDVLHISLPGAEQQLDGGIQLSLVSITGQVLIQVEMSAADQLQLDIPENLPAGMYFLRTLDDMGSNKTFRLLKN